MIRRVTIFRIRWRRLLTSATLGSWLLAVFVATVQGCGLHAAEMGLLQQQTTASTVTPIRGGDDSLPGCEDFCSTATAGRVLELQTLQIQSGAHVQLALSSRDDSAKWRPVSAQFTSPRPPPLPAVDLNIRFVRFAL